MGQQSYRMLWIALDYAVVDSAAWSCPPRISSRSAIKHRPSPDGEKRCGRLRGVGSVRDGSRGGWSDVHPANKGPARAAGQSRVAPLRGVQRRGGGAAPDAHRWARRSRNPSLTRGTGKGTSPKTRGARDPLNYAWHQELLLWHVVPGMSYLARSARTSASRKDVLSE